MGYDDFLAECITHPQVRSSTVLPGCVHLSVCHSHTLNFAVSQMIELHKLMLGPEVRFDHNTLLSRRDFVGQHWHSHGYVEDNAGVTTRPGGAKLRLVRSLVY